jgi:hypothetical protein
VIGGSAVVKGVCAAAGEQMSQDASNPHDAATLRVLFGIREFSHIF